MYTRLRAPPETLSIVGTIEGLPMPASHPMHTPIPAYEIRTQKAAIAVGAAFSLIGVLGFVPGITTHAALFGIFAVSVAQNLVHLLFGVTGLVLARTFTGARRFLIIGGVTYLAISVYRLGTDHRFAVSASEASTWLHLGLAVVMTALGVGLSRAPTDDGRHIVTRGTS